MGTRSTDATHLPHQLSLPFQDQELGSFCLQPELPPLLPQHVWTSLSPTTQGQVRATMLRILQEILDDDARWSNGHWTSVGHPPVSTPLMPTSATRGKMASVWASKNS
jgi:hypothetical protein